MTAHVSPDAPRPPTGIRDSGGPMPFNEADFTRDAAELVAEGDRVPAQRGDTCVMTMTLADFLLARIEEDESVARQAEVDLGRFDRENVANGGKYTGTQGAITLLAMRDGNAMDPARVLAECEAKRQIVERCEEAHQQLRLGAEYGLTYYYGLLVACQTLALPYADHPDYRQEWKP